MNNIVTGRWNGLLVEGEVITGDWEGHPEVPGGKKYLPPYTDWVSVTVFAGRREAAEDEGVDLYDKLDQSSKREIEQILIDIYLAAMDK